MQQGGATGNTALVSTGGLYTVRATDNNGCLSTASRQVEQVLPPTASNFSSSGVLGAGTCSVQLNALATGNAFVFTGPGGYVFSNVYRTGGTYAVFGQNVKLPGTYTLTIYSGPGCAPVTYTTEVTGTACP